MKVRAKVPLRYKDIRYEVETVFEADPDDLIYIEPYVTKEEESFKTINQRDISHNNKKTRNTNRRENENATTVDENNN